MRRRDNKNGMGDQGVAVQSRCKCSRADDTAGGVGKYHSRFGSCYLFCASGDLILPLPLCGLPSSRASGDKNNVGTEIEQDEDWYAAARLPR